MELTTISVDLAKSVFEVAVSERPGRISARHRLSREAFSKFFVNRRPSLVIMEACGSAHYWGRRIVAAGHKVVLLAPHIVRPYVIGNKTDRSDAKGLLEAHRNEQIRPVPVKSVEQQAIGGPSRSVATIGSPRATFILARETRLSR